MTQTVTIKGAGNFELPEGRLLRHFENQNNYAIVDTTEAAKGNSLGVIDSIHTRAIQGEDALRGALVSLVTRHGAKPVAALA